MTPMWVSFTEGGGQTKGQKKNTEIRVAVEKNRFQGQWNA